LHLENRVFIRNPMPLREIAKVIESADLGIVPKRKDTFGMRPSAQKFGVYGDGRSRHRFRHAD